MSAAMSKSMRNALRRMGELVAHDPEVRAARASADDLASIRTGASTSIELVAAACQRYAARPCFGVRNPDAAAYSTVTYADLWARVVGLSTGLAGIARSGELVGIAGPPSVDWIVADLACSYVGAVSVPLQSGDAQHVLKETGLRCVFTSAELLAEVASVACVVRMGDEMRALEKSPPNAPAPSRREDDALVSIVYTSGSTGAPKGVLLHEARWARTLRDALETTPLPTITVGYLPLHHMAGRIGVYTTLMTGGVTHFVARSDMSTLFDDIRIARPTTLTLVPRMSAMIYQHFQSELLRRGAPASSPKEMLEHPLAGPLIDEMRRTFLGDRLCLVTTGAAPTPPEIAAFLTRCFDVHVVDAYGSTEFGRVAVDGRILPWVDYKLVDVPELGYTTADKPFPRGELAVKSPREAPGYFKNAEASARLRDADGYVLSGDIVEQRAPGEIVVIDRKNSVVRLAQGEFVNLARLEDRYVADSPLVEQMFIDASVSSTYLVAVVVPSRRAIEATLPGADDLAQKRALRAELDRVARSAGLAPYEMIRDFVLEPRPFTASAGLLTEANKPRRPRLKEAYGSKLNELRAAIEARQVRGIEGAAGSLRERALLAVSRALGIDEASLDTSISFVGLGGDSLAAVRLAELVRQACGVSVSVVTLLDASRDLAHLAAHVEAAATRSPFAELHGDDAEWVRAKDLTVDRFVEPKEAPLATGPAQTLLLTGASGFLGRFVLLDLLERARRVVCVVRAPDAAAARARIRAGFAKGGDELTRRFDAVSEGLVVHAGDVMQAQLGLADEAYADIADRVDAIVHASALVNHALPYPHLFEPNVIGTVQVMRLALAGRRKALRFVSTGGIAAGIKRAAPILEDESAASLWPRRPVWSDAYALGYATSKWACEVLLEDLHRRCGVPVSVFRCGMILAHSSYSAEFNEADAFTRLVYGLAKTKIAPSSFYTDGASRHYDGLPVDLVAGFIGAIATANDSGSRIYHVSNSNWTDGVGLDAVTDALEEAGCRVSRMSYREWFLKFKDALGALPKDQRRRTPLPVIARWEHPASEGARLDTRAFRDALRASTPWKEIPSLASAYIAQTVRAIASS